MISFFEVFARALFLVHVLPVHLESMLISDQTCNKYTLIIPSGVPQNNTWKRYSFSYVSIQFVQKRLQNCPATAARLEILTTRFPTSSTDRLTPFILRTGYCLLPISVTLVVPLPLDALAFLKFAYPGIERTGVDWHCERLHTCPDRVGRAKCCGEPFISLVDVECIDVEERRRFSEAFVIRAIKNLAFLFDPGKLVLGTENEDDGRPTVQCTNRRRRP
jgi:hypothetical protein